MKNSGVAIEVCGRLNLVTRQIDVMIGASSYNSPDRYDNKLRNFRIEDFNDFSSSEIGGLYLSQKREWEDIITAVSHKTESYDQDPLPLVRAQLQPDLGQCQLSDGLDAAIKKAKDGIQKSDFIFSEDFKNCELWMKAHSQAAKTLN